MRRREFIAVLGGAAVTWPLRAWTQQPRMPVVGFANGQSPAAFAYLVAAFREGLSQSGYVEGKSVAIEYRWAEGQDSRMPTLIGELVRMPVDVLAIGGSGRAPFLAKEFSSSVPAVATDGDDPVRQGLVASLNRPGGNFAVAMVYSTELEGKRLEILHKLLPQAELIGVLVDPSFTGTALQVKQYGARA
jgi:putative tryptophan/tyrosine transport system substrate-binding protein